MYKIVIIFTINHPLFNSENAVSNSLISSPLVETILRKLSVGKYRLIPMDRTVMPDITSNKLDSTTPKTKAMIPERQRIPDANNMLRFKLLNVVFSSSVNSYSVTSSCPRKNNEDNIKK